MKNVNLFGFEGTVVELEQKESFSNFTVQFEGAETSVEVSQKEIQENPETTPYEIAFSIALDEFGLLEN